MVNSSTEKVVVVVTVWVVRMVMASPAEEGISGAGIQDPTQIFPRSSVSSQLPEAALLYAAPILSYLKISKST